MQETWVPSLIWEDPLEKEIATHSCILAWKFHGQRSLEGYSPWGHKESGTTKAAEHTCIHTQSAQALEASFTTQTNQAIILFWKNGFNLHSKTQTHTLARI